MSTPRTEFQVHILNDQGISKAGEIASVFSDALAKIEVLVPSGRERSLTFTGTYR